MIKHVNKACPHCGENVKVHWKICPVCETRLPGQPCPGCGLETLSHWNICPECHARLSSDFTKKNGTPDLAEMFHGHDGKKPATWKDPLSGIMFILVSGGSFLMGDQSNEGLENERPVHEVRLDDFYLARTPVTQKQWQHVTGQEGGSPATGPDHPVTHIDFNDIRAFLKILNDHHTTGRRFTLPSEAQWEYAARSGGKNQRYSGSDTPESVAWYGENSEGFPHEVALKKPNELGFYDMSGNVWEWCQDVFSEFAYTSHDLQNPVLESASIKDRVARGGNWLMDAWSIRCTRRFSFPENVSGQGLGFRPAMIVP